jgi:hypothetical protein
MRRQAVEEAKQQWKKMKEREGAVFRIRIRFFADPDPT